MLDDVVFIQYEDDGPIRITATKNAQKTLENIQRYHFAELRLAATANQAGWIIVKKIQEIFIKESLGNNWYDPSNRIVAMVAHIQKHPDELYQYIQVKVLGKTTKKKLTKGKPKASKIKIDKTKVKDRLQREIEAGTLSVRRLDDDAAAD